MLNFSFLICKKNHNESSQPIKVRGNTHVTQVDIHSAVISYIAITDTEIYLCKAKLDLPVDDFMSHLNHCDTIYFHSIQ